MEKELIIPFATLRTDWLLYQAVMNEQHNARINKGINCLDISETWMEIHALSGLLSKDEGKLQYE